MGARSTDIWNRGEGEGRGLAEAATSLARDNIAHWLSDNGDMLAATFGPKCAFYPVVASSIVEGLLTTGSDVDLCMMFDNVELTYKHFLLP